MKGSHILAQPVGQHDHTRGPDDAPITVVEYGDYECPECRLAYLILADVLQELGDGVRFVFRNFPVSDEHAHAMVAAEAAESVAARGGEDAFWNMHDLLYENQDALQHDDLDDLTRRGLVVFAVERLRHVRQQTLAHRMAVRPLDDLHGFLMRLDHVSHEERTRQSSDDDDGDDDEALHCGPPEPWSLACTR